MAIPAINVLGNPNVTEGNFQIAIEDLRKSVIGSGKAYDAANTYSQYDTCVSGGIVYYSKINSNTGNTPAIGVNWGLVSELIKLVASPTTNALAKIQADGTIKNSSIIEDTNGNWGFGVTPSAWFESGKHIQTLYSAFGESAAGHSDVQNNSYEYANNAYKYIRTGLGASRYVANFGNHIWKIAPSGTAGNVIPWIDAMSLTNTGNLLINTSTDNGVDKLQVNGSIGATKSNLRTGVQYGTSSTLTVTVPANSSGTLCINAYYNGNQAHTWTLPWTYYTDSAKAVGTPLSAGNATLISSAVINNGGNIVVTLANSSVYLSYSLSITN